MRYSVDTMFSLQENAAAPDDVSALERAWHTPGYPRLIYAVYAMLGIIFFGIGLYTALGVLMRSLNAGTVLEFRTAIFLCYVLINSIIGYGFMFYRKWLLTAFASTLALIGFSALFFFISGAFSRATSLRMSILIITSILLFLFLTKSRLSGKYLELTVIIPFVLALLFSFLLTNFGVLH